MHIGASLWVLLALPQLMQAVARDSRGSHVRKVMIVEIWKPAHGRGSVRHEHRRCENRDRSCKLLPGSRSSRADGLPFHRLGTPGRVSSSMSP